MTRHIADHPRESRQGRAENFTRQERESGIHPVIAALRMRPRTRDEAVNHRAAEFSRIERGYRT